MFIIACTEIIWKIFERIGLRKLDVLYILGTVDFELLAVVPITKDVQELITDHFYVSYKYSLLTIFEKRTSSQMLYRVLNTFLAIVISLLPPPFCWKMYLVKVSKSANNFQK